MTVTTANTKATAALRKITHAALETPRAPIELSRPVAQALQKKLVALAKKDPPKASGLVDLMEELNKKGLLSLNYNTGTMPWGNNNAWSMMMNAVKTVLNNNAVTFDDKPLSPLMR